MTIVSQIKMTKPLYPYQNLSLTDIRGETWKPVPGFEGHYDVSSFGRIKSLYRERVLHHGGILPISARILRQRCSVVTNKTINEQMHTLTTTLNLEGVKYYFSVGRLVYHAFIAPIALKDRSVLISYKDGNSFNLKYSNLFATDTGQLRNASYEKGRYKSHLRKTVSQFDTEGNLIAQYDSAYAAGKSNDIESRGIANAASGKGVLYKGSVWQYSKSSKMKANRLQPKASPQINEALHLSQEELLHIPAVVNTELKNMKGERWKDFPGYEGLYRISNFGRVKALAKISEGGNKKQWYPEAIKKLTAANRKTTSLDNRATLIVTLCKERKKKTLSVARYVFFLFVQSFDLNDRALRVYYRDGNQYNLHYTNLELKNASWSIQKGITSKSRS